MYTFDTPSPIQLTVSNHAGRVSVEAADVTESTVQLTAIDADAEQAIAEAVVEHRHEHLVVHLPRGRSGLFRNRAPKVAVDVRVPTDSTVRAKLHSASLSTTGAFSDLNVELGSGNAVVDTVTGSARINSGSGDLQLRQCDGDLTATLGSGDIHVDTVLGRVQTRSGSGDVTIGHAGGAVTAGSGSGDIMVGTSESGIAAKTGSGDVRVTDAQSGEVKASTASGDVAVGIAQGTAVWLDLNTISGSVRNDLDAIAQPEETERKLTLRVKTASGDISVARAS